MALGKRNVRAAQLPKGQARIPSFFSSPDLYENQFWNLMRYNISLRIIAYQVIDAATIWRCNCRIDRAIFVLPWKENVRTKQKQDTNRNRVIWLVYRTDTNTPGFWLVNRTLVCNNFMPDNFLEINRYFALTSYCNTIGQSNNAFSILVFSAVEN